MTCPQCGANLVADSKFCNNCGVRLEVSSEQPSFVPPATAVAQPVVPAVQSKSDNPYAQVNQAQKSKKGLYAAIIGVLVIAVGAIGWLTLRPMFSATPGTPQESSFVSVDGGAIQVGNADAKVIVNTYFDYICPWCGRFEQVNGADLRALAESGKIKLVLHPLSFFDQYSQGTKYSTRAANAALVVAKEAPNAFLAFNEALWANQPAEETTGLSDEQIADYAKTAGVPQDVIAKFNLLSNEKLLAESTIAASESGVSGTPAIFINGQQFQEDFTQPGVLKAAIEAAS